MSGDYILRDFIIVDLDKNTRTPHKDVNAMNVLRYILETFKLTADYSLCSIGMLDISVRFIIEQHIKDEVVCQWILYPA